MKLPDLSLDTLQGETIRLRPEPAAPRLLVVYADGCDACDLLLPAVERLSRSLHARGIETIGVSQSDGEATLDLINEHGLCFPQTLDRDLALSTALDVAVLPTIVLARADGEIVDRCEALDLAALRRLLATAAEMCGLDAADLERALGSFRLPESRPGSASRSRDPTS